MKRIEEPKRKRKTQAEEELEDTERLVVESAKKESIKSNLLSILDRGIGAKFDKNEIENIQSWLLEYPELINISNNDSLNLLHFAVFNNSPVEFITLLLSKGISIDSQEKQHKATALHFAAAQGYLEIVKLLLDSGANKNIKDKNDKLPADVASNSNVKDTIARHIGSPTESHLKKSAKVEQFALEKAPKLIHFIWAGGDALMFDRNIAHVKEWSKSNDDFQIILWVDQNTAPAGINLVEEYAKKFEGYKNVIIKDIQNPADKDDICTPYVRYEIDRVDPNYGASSDLLRYRILYKYGGAYFDSDVKPGKNRLNELAIFNEQPKEHQLYVDHLSQMPAPPPEGLQSFNLSGKIGTTAKMFGLGNDTFICTPHNPAIKLFSDSAEENYRLRNNAKLFEIQMLTAYGSHDIKELTILKTGPTIISNAILQPDKDPKLEKKNDHFIKTIDSNSIQIRPVRYKDHHYTQPAPKNFKDWLDVGKTKLKEKHELELIYNKLINTINFEIENLGIIRLEDHIRFLRMTAHTINVDPIQTCEHFLHKLESHNLPYANINIAQSISLDSMVVNFYKKHSLHEKSYLLPTTNNEHFAKIANHVMSVGLFKVLSLITSENTFQELLDKEIYRKAQVNTFIEQLHIGMGFIEKILEDQTIGKLGLGDNPCADVLDYYRDVGEALNKHYDKKVVDIDVIESLKKKVEDQLTQAIIFGFRSQVPQNMGESNPQEQIKPPRSGML